MTIQKCDRTDHHGAHALDNKPYELICPGEPPTKVKHLEGRWRNGVGLDEYLPGNVKHLVAPIVGWLKYDLPDGKYPGEQISYYILHRLETLIDLANDQIEKDNK